MKSLEMMKRKPTASEALVMAVEEMELCGLVKFETNVTANGQSEIDQKKPKAQAAQTNIDKAA